MQKAVEEANCIEQGLIANHIANELWNISMNYHGKRIIQLIFEKFDVIVTSQLLQKIAGYEILLATDYNGTHVVQVQ